MFMKKIFSLLILMLISSPTFAQYEYEPSGKYPFGRLNPKAYPQTGDFAPLIGSSECISETRTPDGSWNKPVSMIWKFKYIMNGMAVQDETLKEDGVHSGSIRQFNPDSSAWFVHYYSSGSAAPALPAWKGGKNENGDIILYREQKAPNGMDGFYKINFTEITEEGFEWFGEWVNIGETFSYPAWKISCKKTDDG